MRKNKVAVIMGSKSDLPIVQHGVDVLKKFEVPHDVKVLSAHRTPRQTMSFAKNAGKNGYSVIIAAAGGAAHLAGVIAAHTTLPVVGIPIETKALGGVDSLFSTVQMPSGIPVGCMAIGKSGAINAALFAIEILATSDKALQKRLSNHKEELAAAILKK